MINKSNLWIAIKYFGVAMLSQLFSTIILEVVGNRWITLVPIYIVDIMVFVFFVRKISLLKESYQINILDIIFGVLSIGAMMYVFSVLLGGSGDSVLWQSKIYFYAFLPTAIIVGPIYEEVIFRHYIIRGFKLEWVGVIISSILFSILHTSNDIISYLVYFIEALILYGVYKSSKRIVNPILVHGIMNSLVIVCNI